MATTMTSKPKVMIIGSVILATDKVAELGTIADVMSLPQSTTLTRADFLAQCRAGAFDGVVALMRTFLSVGMTGRFDEELVAALPASLRFVCHNGAGYDQIDVGVCARRRIAVSHTPAVVDDATSDMAIFLLLGALRGLWKPMTDLRLGHWRGLATPPRGHDPAGKIVGILGMGSIGSHFARKVHAFNVRLRYHNRTRLSPDREAELGAEYVDLDTLLAESDVLSVHLPLNPQTRYMIGAPQFAKMKRGIVLINTARGAILDEAALVRALNDGTVSAAGIDVYENEPAIHPGLVAHQRAMLVPHLATYTFETETKMEECCLANLRAAAFQGRLVNLVPEQAGMGLSTKL